MLQASSEGKEALLLSRQHSSLENTNEVHLFSSQLRAASDQSGSFDQQLLSEVLLLVMME